MQSYYHTHFVETFWVTQLSFTLSRQPARFSVQPILHTIHNTKPTIMRGLAARPPIPSNREKRDDVDSRADGDPLQQQHHQQQPSRKPLPSYHHYWPLHHLHHPEDMHRVRRRGTPDAVTASTTSLLSASSLNERSAGGGRPVQASRGGRCPRLMGGFRRKRSGWSESQLRKTARKHAERGDWPALHRLISGHKFPDVPEVIPKRLGGGGGAARRRLRHRPARPDRQEAVVRVAQQRGGTTVLHQRREFRRRGGGHPGGHARGIQ